ncbi:hypothetical protein AKG95_20500 [Janthinobacterium lividum]|uniref:Uncharacterized protein n=1 Tax=Janthinobacterium lividum TaxID=29581 RepID=A0A1S1U502_9BURK|nr:hypothetical protein [Janthinobacterium lividum]OHV95525.1 hypothetical protein AKG95_20500 [Janthinobacterium lividum]
MRTMNTSDFWKNFRLGEEVHIAGTFIYNALRRFHELEQFDNTDELFEFLYNLSVGIERLLKITIVLHEHSNVINQEQLEKSLITHSHLDLLSKVRSHVDIKLGKSHNDLLQLLSTFYKTLRYDRFSLNSVYEGQKEVSAIIGLLNKHLNVEISNRSSPFAPLNEDRYRAFIRRTVLAISQPMYEVIEKRARSLGLYTYELRYGSKAESVFLRKINVSDEDVLWKELLIFFMNSDPKTGYLKFLKGLEPLKFDPGLIRDYLDCFKSDASKAEVMDELEHHYGEMDKSDRKQRFEIMGLIGAQGVYFDDEGDIEGEDEQ